MFSYDVDSKVNTCSMSSVAGTNFDPRRDSYGVTGGAFATHRSAGPDEMSPPDWKQSRGGPRRSLSPEPSCLRFFVRQLVHVRVSLGIRRRGRHLGALRP